MLQANRGLGWRDVQDILALTARHSGSAVNDIKHGYELDTWAFNHATTWNGGGMHFSNDYGFGLVDARAAVALAKTWSIAFPTAHTSANELVATASVSGAWDVGHARTNTLTFKMTAHQAVEEMVIDLTDLRSSYGGHLIVDLISPTGTVSNLLDRNGGAAAITAGWELMSREFRGEDSYGTWSLRITDTTATDTGSLTKATLKAYGSAIADNSVFVFTDEFVQYATPERSKIAYTAGPATIDAAPISGDMVLNLLTGIGSIDGKAISIAAGTLVKTVIGGDGNNTLTGNNSGDKLIGGLGSDKLVGGSGADVLDGWGGSNILTGGAGADKFGLHAAGFNAVSDFVSGVDKFLVAALEFGGDRQGRHRVVLRLRHVLHPCRGRRLRLRQHAVAPALGQGRRERPHPDRPHRQSHQAGRLGLPAGLRRPTIQSPRWRTAGRLARFRISGYQPSHRSQ